jgi:Protein of unknown function (DUF3040)
MSLSAWEQQALDSIRDGLTGSDPGLAALLVSFTRLADGEEMPARETVRTGSRRAICRPRRGRQSPRRGGARRAGRLLGYRWTALLLWLAITAGLITVGLVFSRGGQSTCTTVSWSTVCANPAPAPGSHPTAHDPSGGQTPALVPVS